MILDDLAASARARVEHKNKMMPFDEVKRRALKIAAEEHTFVFPFERAITRAIAHKELSFICEVKKASPSKGMIAEDFSYREIAQAYEKAGADCISVLTEPDYFKGDDNYLKEISDMVSVPTLRKDFTVDPYLIYEAKLLGASCVLLIAALLDTDTIREYKAVCDELGLSALVEAHDERVGVNNRDLKTFAVDIQNSIRLKALVPDNILFIAESGIQNARDIQALRDAGVDGVLIGESLMRSRDKAGMLKNLRGM